MYVLLQILLGLSSSVAWHIHIPKTCPQHAAGPIDPNFMGFAFEIASFVEYATTAVNDSSPNAFSLALMEEIASRTGGQPVIRIGGTSADYGYYEASLSQPTYPVAAFNNFQLPNYTLIGDSFFPLTRNFASLNATYIVQIPMAFTNISQTIIWMEKAIQQVGWENIQAIEVGNEPDLYGAVQSRHPNASAPGNFTFGPLLAGPLYTPILTNTSYATTWKNYTQSVIAALNIPTAYQSRFQAGDLAENLAENRTRFMDVTKIFEAGINSEGNVQQFAAHYYQTPAMNESTVGPDLMNHSAIVEGMSNMKAWISYLSRNPNGTLEAPIPFILDEVGAWSTSPATQSLSANGAVLGSALWQVDFQLYAMTMGVTRINFQHIMRALYGLWLPQESAGEPAQTWANFYAMPFVGDFIGNTGGKTKVLQLGISGQLDDQNTVAYMAFNDTVPARLAIVNLQEWPKPQGSASTLRGSALFELHGLPQGRTIVRHLSSPHGAHANASSITYGGSQWTYESGGRETPVVDDSIWFDVGSDGRGCVAVADSSAVLILFGQ